MRHRIPYESDAELREVLDLVRTGHFSVGEPSLFHPLGDGLLEHDPCLVLADFADYARWHRMALLNIAGMGRFSFDRTLRRYAEEIWRCPSVVLSA